MHINEKFRVITKSKYLSEIQEYVTTTALNFGNWNYRETAHKVHKNTLSIPFIIADINKEPETYQSLISNETIKTLVDELLFNFPSNSVATMVVLINLPVSKNITAHIDSGVYLTKIHRCHLPIFTNTECTFFVRDTKFTLTEGIWYEVSNQDYHSVDNNGTTDRIHLLVDVYTPNN